MVLIKMWDCLNVVLLFALVGPTFTLPLKNAEMDSARYNYFDIDLLRASPSTGNILLAPALIKSGLNILLTGAKGPTARELSTALRLPKEKNRRDDLLKDYGNALKSDSASVILRSAGSLFLSDKLPTPQMTNEYVEMLKNIHKTDVHRMDFTDTKKASQSINNWINHATLGSIPEFLQESSLDPHSSLILTNAVYYRALWAKAFDKSDTRESCFTSNIHIDNDCQKVEMMMISDEFGYADLPELDSTAVEMDYAGNEYSMLVVLPNRGTDVWSLVRDLPYASLAHIDARMTTQEVRIRLPKFTIDYEADLAHDLKELGISTLFSPQNDLSGIFESNKPIPVTSIMHKTVLEVSESGSVGAAVGITSIVPLMGSIAPLFDASRPFVYFIRHKKTGAVIFEGVLRQPTAVKDGDNYAHLKDVPNHFGQFNHKETSNQNSDIVMNYEDLNTNNHKIVESQNYQTLNYMKPQTPEQFGNTKKMEVMYGDAPMRAMRISANNRPMNIDNSNRSSNINYSGGVNFNTPQLNKNTPSFRYSFGSIKFGDNSDGILFRER